MLAPGICGCDLSMIRPGNQNPELDSLTPLLRCNVKVMEPLEAG